MGDGLERFAKGMALSLLEKAKETGRSPSAQLMQEEDEMALLLGFLQNKLAQQTDDNSDRDFTIGLLGAALFGQYLIEGLAAKTSDSESLQDGIQCRAEAFTKFFHDFERASIALEGSVSNVKRLKKAWINAVKKGSSNSQPEKQLVESIV